MTDQPTIQEPITTDAIAASINGEDVASAIDAGASSDSNNRHEDVPARAEDSATIRAPRHNRASGAMCALLDDAPTARDLLANDAAAAARATGKRTDLLRYLRLRRK